MTTINAIDTSNPVGISSGGTSASTATAAFNAISPLTTKGDLIIESGGLNSRLSVSAVDGMAIVVDATAGPLWNNQSIVAKSSSVTLTSAQIKALRATPIEILAAPPSGYLNIPVDLTVKFTYGGTNAFTNAQSTSLHWGNQAGTEATDNFGTTLINGTVNTYSNASIKALTVFPSSNIQATNLVFCNNGASEITGNAANNNTLTLSISYVTLII